MEVSGWRGGGAELERGIRGSAGRENSARGKECESYFEIMRERHNIHMYLCVFEREEAAKTEELKKKKKRSHGFEKDNYLLK